MVKLTDEQKKVVVDTLMRDMNTSIGLSLKDFGIEGIQAPIYVELIGLVVVRTGQRMQEILEASMKG